jgi:hypothetical protein
MQTVPGSDTPQTAHFIARDVDGTHIDQYGAAAAAANEAILQPDAAGAGTVAAAPSGATGRYDRPA